MTAELWRDANGTVHVDAATLEDALWGQGVAHATDRAVQLLLMRILVQGRVAELLTDNDQSIEIDSFFRRMNWKSITAQDMAELSEFAARCLRAYCAGVNSVLQRKTPWEFSILGYHPSPWQPEDTVAIARMFGYVGLQQSQATIERLLVEMVQAGIDERKLNELFPGLLAGADMELIKRVDLTKRVVPPSIVWGSAAVTGIASNNWAVAGAKTASGLPILANDPHLEGNRIPNVWSEIALHCRDRYLIGGSMPGCPGVMIGRTNDVAWGATYPFMDAVDSWVERCRDGRYYRLPDQWLPFRKRRELIRRKRHAPVEVAFFENDHGVLDGNPYHEGLYLATRWSADRAGARSVDRLLQMWNVHDTAEAMDVLGQIETAWNFVIADRQGNIGYQMSGLMPRRRAGVSGFVPLPGWDPDHDWRGMVPHDQLPRALNPADGIFVTANNNLNRYGQADPIAVCMGPYRAERIRELLGDRTQLTVDDMATIQQDLYSNQAERYMEILRPLLPKTRQGGILRDWDLCYDAESRGAFLFEEFYQALVREVFGRGGLGDDVISFFMTSTGTLIDFYENFDRVLLSPVAAWFGGRSRDDIYRDVAAQCLDTEPQTWGKGRTYWLSHLVFGNKLPRFFGFDRGPVTAVGGRATIHQGQIYRSQRRLTTFVPSYRLITDMAHDSMLSNMLGGPSDRRFSRWYCSGLTDWLAGRYKQTEGLDHSKRRRFP